MSYKIKIGFNNLGEYSAYNGLCIMTLLAKKVDENNVEATLTDDLPYISLSTLALATMILETGMNKKKKYKKYVEMTPKQFEDFKSIISKLKKALNEYKIGDYFKYRISIQEHYSLAVIMGLPESEIIWE